MALVTTNTATFDGRSLTSVTGVTVLRTDPFLPAKRKLTINDIARTNKAKTNSAFYDKKTVTIRVAITRDTRDQAEQSLDSLLSILQGIEKELVVRQSGGLRKYTSTLADNVFQASGGSYLEIDLVFETSDHFGYDNAVSLLAQVTGFTSATKTTQVVPGGSAPWQVPVITITFTALVGTTSNIVRVGNDGTGQMVTITRTWAAGDVIEIDARNQTVKVNGTEVEFSGAIPEWAPETGYITVSDTFTSRTYNMLMTYFRRFV